jgi:hypothetical protein
MAQRRFSEEPHWKTESPAANGVLPLQPFKGLVTREEPAVRTCIETRRKDVGPQGYASGNYMPMIHKEPVYGTLPTAEAVFFLKHHYGDSSHPHPKSRFFP